MRMPIFYWESPIRLWKERSRLHKKLKIESEDYRRRYTIDNLITWYGILVYATLVSIAILIAWLP